MTKMTLSSSKLTLYPANWLYNAGVVGFLRVLDAMGEDVEGMLREDGGVEVETKILEENFNKTSDDLKGTILEGLPSYWWSYLQQTTGRKFSMEVCKPLKVSDIKDLLISEIQSDSRKKNSPIRIKKKKVDIFHGNSRNYKILEIENKLVSIYNSNDKEEIINICDFIPPDVWRDYLLHRYLRQGLGALNDIYKNMINNTRWRDLGKIIEDFKNLEPFANRNKSKVGVCIFCGHRGKVYPLNYMFSSDLFPADGFPNSAWNLSSLSYYCKKCEFFVIHRHIGMTDLGKNSLIFINAPSFKIMWYLNRYAREIYGREKAKRVEQILGMSLIEMTLRLNRELSRWTAMNIEVVLKRGDEINFFSLPYEVVRIITNRKVASLLSRINRYDVLNLVLKGDFEGILRMGERMLRERMNLKDEKEEEKSKKEKKGKKKIDFYTPQRLFQLYAAISDVLKEEVEYDRYDNL